MNPEPRFKRLSAAQAVGWLAANPQALVLDARDARHHQIGHISGAAGQVLRLDGRNHEPLLLREDKARPVFVYCYHGNASQTYAQMFADFGFASVVDLIGGFDAWAAARQPQAIPAPPPAPARPAAAAAAPLPPALVAWLAAQGLADAHMPGAHGNTPLMQAAWRGDAAMVDALLAQGVDLAASNSDGNNALWLACVANDPALVRRLVQAGVAIDHANLTGATCLMYAASSSKPQIVAALLALGADATLTTQDDFSALDMAASLDCLQLLRVASRAPRGVAALG